MVKIKDEDSTPEPSPNSLPQPVIVPREVKKGEGAIS
jgi:hypothetical protein